MEKNYEKELALDVLDTFKALMSKVFVLSRIQIANHQRVEVLAELLELVAYASPHLSSIAKTYSAEFIVAYRKPDYIELKGIGSQLVAHLTIQCEDITNSLRITDCLSRTNYTTSEELFENALVDLPAPTYKKTFFLVRWFDKVCNFVWG